MEYTVKTVSNLDEARRVWEMFLIPNIIGALSEGEKQQFRKNIEATLNSDKAAFFYVEDESGNIIGAVGAWENYLKNGGFIIEHFAVVEEMRGKGIGKLLFNKAEEFIQQFHPRYISIETGDNPFYAKATEMYKKFGYKAVSHFPKYYDESTGRVDYMKVF